MLPSLENLTRVSQQILTIPNNHGEFKRKIHYCLFLLGQKAGLRVSEAVNFDLSKKSRQGLYRIKTKGKKSRYVYIPKRVISELKKCQWKPNHTNRFNFYHFLKKIKRVVNLPTNTELTPHTLRRAFATYHAENGLPLPLLSKMLGHTSVRTTALYWMNIHYDDDNDDRDAGAILAGKTWLEKPKKNEPKKPPVIQPPLESELIKIPHYCDQNLLTEQQINQELQQQLTAKDKKMVELERENADLQQDLSNLSEQNTVLVQEKSQAQQTISQLTQELASEQEKRNATEANFTQEKQINHNLRQQLQTEQKTNTNLTQKLSHNEQTITNLQTAYQQALKVKETTQKQLNHLLSEIKTAAKQFHHWQKLSYYQQLEQKNQFKAQIIHPPLPIICLNQFIKMAVESD